MQALGNERAALAESRERWFLQAIENLTHLGLHRRMTESVQQALRQFQSALVKLPKTQGAKSTVRIRRMLRSSIQRAMKAIPCWVMPEWRVAEQLPPELESFDLVIIDEASQSNIMALPVVLRGRKLLIVGDDRQVSPTAVGIDESAVTRLRSIHLSGQHLADQIDPATSLYELGGMALPGQVTVLREHFRCVEPIIRFSSRFYKGGLVPLRLPPPSERLDPPLIDILVRDGARRGNVNRAEAAVIVDQVRAIIADPLMRAAKRSIGVISLHAAAQAKLIYDLLIAAIGPEIMSEHRIMCGDAATFQGQERDIVFLSMVHDQTTATRQSSRLYEQRYNVALSRARDRMVLVRSVTTSMLREGDIKLEVLRHFQDPTGPGGIGQPDDVLKACESNFEREVGRRLLDCGYRLRAQVPAGGYFIDFVVEGADDRRLAIELDGDSFHGPDRWERDVLRQKSLERVGWVFWRCWASEWEANKEAAFADLTKTLSRAGVTPIGVTATGGVALVAFREVFSRPPTEPADHVVAERLPSPGISLEPALVPELRAPQPPDSRTIEDSPQAAIAERRVSVGDSVVVRYADGNARALTIQIVADGSADGRTRITSRSPLAAAILGLRAEDETEVVIDGAPRSVIVEEIRTAA